LTCSGATPKLCNGTCIASTACCSSAECTGGKVCASNQCGCSGTTPKDCNGTCIASTACCSSGECGTGKACSSSHQCVCDNSNTSCGTGSSCVACGSGQSCSSGACQCLFGAKSVCNTCLGWNFEDGTPGAWTSTDVVLSASSPGYGGTGWALSWHHYYTNDASSGIFLKVPLCAGGSSSISITGISLQARFVPDSGYGEFPNTTASKLILLDAGGVQLNDSFTPFGAQDTWSAVSRTFTSTSGAYLQINLQAMDSWQGTIFIDNLMLTP